MPTDYTSLTNVKAAMKIDSSDTDDDDYIESLITAASRTIDNECSRFFAGEAQTRYYDVSRDVMEGQVLLLDQDLISVMVLTNGDGEVIDSDEYVLLPANETPKYAIQLLAGSGKSWTFEVDPQQAISINGSWGYAATTPAAIRQATERLVVTYYKLRDTPFGTVGIPAGGFGSITLFIPDDIRLILEPYHRRRFGGV